MKDTFMTRGSLLRLIAVGSLALSAACTLESQNAPDPIGPSELSMSLALTATPDLIAANGASQSVIGIVTRDAYGQPLPNVQLRVDTVDASGLIVENGILSARTITTGSNGQASLTYTAPMETVAGVDANGAVTVRVLPISTDFGSQYPRYVTIRLLPPTTVIVPGAAIASYTFFPGAPKVGDRVIFDASGSKDLDGSIVLYTWEWGDGSFASRYTPAEDHDFASAGLYYVKLTLTDNEGKQSFITKPITVN
jgi:PKD domain-containing protein